MRCRKPSAGGATRPLCPRGLERLSKTVDYPGIDGAEGGERIPDVDQTPGLLMDSPARAAHGRTGESIPPPIHHGQQYATDLWGRMPDMDIRIGLRPPPAEFVGDASSNHIAWTTMAYAASAVLCRGYSGTRRGTVPILFRGFPVEVTVEVKFQARKRGLRISRNHLFLLGSGARI